MNEESMQGVQNQGVLELLAQAYLEEKRAQERVAQIHERVMLLTKQAEEFFALNPATEKMTVSTGDHAYPTVTISKKQAYFASVKKEDQEEFKEWLRANGHDELIIETINAGSLKSFCQELEENGYEMPPQITTHRKTVLQLRRNP